MVAEGLVFVPEAVEEGEARGGQEEHQRDELALVPPEFGNFHFKSSEASMTWMVLGFGLCCGRFGGFRGADGFGGRGDCTAGRTMGARVVTSNLNQNIF